jgi:KipI family sensor histidine kinase inhibitor
MDVIRAAWGSERQVHVECSGAPAAACCAAIVRAGINGVRDVVPGSRTVQVSLEPGADPDATLTRLRAALESASDEDVAAIGREVEVPICSADDLAPDLVHLAGRAGLTTEAAADLHASGTHTVRFVGFSPGFPYMDGLPAALHAPRLDTPRPRVRAGSVGIAGDRTGIYPQPTPGGWLLIGATPLKLFDPARASPSLLQPGDRVRFRRINRAEFDAIEREQA